ncbi:DUF397 domain-containing protein [Actinoallomurus sp. NPDC050550]
MPDTSRAQWRKSARSSSGASCVEVAVMQGDDDTEED